MEKKLKKMFEYQRFARNKRLEKMLSEAENSITREIDDEELAYVAGGTHTLDITEKNGVKVKYSQP